MAGLRACHARAVRLGIHLPQFGRPVTAGEIVRVARVAEETGVADLWVSDHVAVPAGSTSPPELFHDALTVLTWAAAVTERIGLGTSVLVAPYRHPLVLARSLASLDALSGGRLICGIASGWHEGEFAALGVPWRGRGRRTDDTIRLLRAVWAGETSFTSSTASFEGMTVAPGPARAGGPPVWVGGNSEAGIGRAARLGDGWQSSSAEPEAIARRLERLDAALAEAGRSRAEVTVGVRMRAGVDEVGRRVPALADLGVDHLLVDPPFDGPAPAEVIPAYAEVVAGA